MFLKFLLVSAAIAHHVMAQTPCEIYTEKFECEGPSRPMNDYDCGTDLVATTLDLLERGDKEIEYSDGEEAVMLIGTTGTGKSTLAYFIAGNNSQMISYKKSTGTYLIKDCHGKISGNSTIVSATIFPDLVVHEATQTSFYDNPGFQDTRTPCIEIANAYFMRKIANHVKKLKFVIVINQNSLVPGSDRVSFIGMIKSVISFLPNIEKYGDGIGLVGTKLKFDVDVETEDPYIEDAKAYMLENRPGLAEVFKDPNDLRKAQFIVDTLTNSNTQNKIGMFRAPTNCGLLSQLENMQDNWKNITNIIQNQQTYIESSPSDFAFSLSSNALIAIKEIAVQLNQNVIDAVGQFSREIYSFVESQFNCLAPNTCDQVIQDLKVIFNNPDFLNEYQDEEVWKNLKYTQIIQRITNPEYLPKNLIISPEIFETLEKSARYLEFLESFDGLGLNVINWLGPMKTINNDLKSHMVGFFTSLDSSVQNITKYITVDLLKDWKARLDYISSFIDDTTIPQLQSTFTNFYGATYPSVNNSQLLPSTYMSEIIANIQTFNEGQGDILTYLDTLQNYSMFMDTLKNITKNRVLNPNPQQWILPLNVLRTDLVNYITLSFVPIIEEKINGTLRALSEDLANKRALEINPLPDVFGKQAKYLEYLNQIIKLKSDLLVQLPGKNLEFFLENVVQGIIDLGMDTSSETVANVYQKIKYLHLIESTTVSTIIPEMRREEWLSTISHGNFIIHDQQYWNDFLIQFFQDLSTIQVQLDDTFGYKSWWSSFADVAITKDNLLTLWEIFESTSAIQNTDYNQLINIGQPNHFSSLNTLLNITLTSDFKCYQHGSVSMGQGRFTSVSQVLSECVKVGTTKTIVILGTYTTFFDVDVVTRTMDSNADNIDVFVMSPKWWMKEERLIDLSGLSSLPPSPDKGSPGISGGKSGNFMGLGQFFEDGSLQVIANGGDASSGRDGRDGVNGQGGHNDPVGGCDPEDKWTSSFIRLNAKHRYSCSNGRDDKPTLPGQTWCDAKWGDNTGIWFHVFGTPGTDAIPPTHGGKMGYGGVEGKIHIAQLGGSASEHIKTPMAIPGKSGVNGVGGRGAQGGQGGTEYHVKGDDKFQFFGNMKCKIIDWGYSIQLGQGQSYPDGIAGGNSQGWVAPKPQHYDPSIFGMYVKLFSSEASGSSHDFFRTILTDFVAKVGEDASIPQRNMVQM